MYAKLHMLNLDPMIVFTFSILNLKPLLGKYGPEDRNFRFKMELVPRLIRTCSIFCSELEIPFWEKLFSY